MKKMLMIASVASMIDQFNRKNIELLQEMGYDVQVAANFRSGNTSSIKRLKEFQEELDQRSIKHYHIEFSRKITNWKQNWFAYQQLVTLITSEKYDFIHCHSPIGGVCGRLAAVRCNIKAIYTAHGFHFYKGAPLINWIFYYPIERLLASATEVLITINQEDYERAKKFSAKNIVYIPGVGIPVADYETTNEVRVGLRKQLGISEDTIVLLSVGEMSKRKNHKVIIKAIAKLNNDNIVYIICGIGKLEKELAKLADKLKVKVIFPGYRNDIKHYYTIADIFAFPSLQEGLPVALMEAMASGLPIICSYIRGNTDLIENCVGGYLIDSKDIEQFAERINTMIQNKRMRDEMALINKKTISNYDEKIVSYIMKNIYESMI